MSKQDKPDTDAEQRMAEALEECRVYNRIGGLDQTMIDDIAFDHDVDPDQLRKQWEA